MSDGAAQEKPNTTASLAKVAILGVATFPNKELTAKMIRVHNPTSEPEEADVLIVLWDGKPGAEKQAIDKAAKERQDLIVIRPNGDFTKMGFGCLLSKT